MNYTDPTLEKTFENNGKIYKYDFTVLTIEQAELGKEIIEWKYTQKANVAENFTDVIKSKGSAWKCLLLSYLMTEVIEGIQQPFDMNKTEETEIFVKSLPTKYMEDVEAVVLDFFQHIGMNRKDYQSLQGKLKQNGIEMLWKILPMLQSLNNNGLISNNVLKETTPLEWEKLTTDSNLQESTSGI